MVVRNKGLTNQQTLAWDDENRLSQVLDGNGNLLERYRYDVDGGRVKKTSGTTTTYTFFAHYEEEVTGVVTTTVSHYSFGGLRFAVKRGNTLYHLHGDHLGSASLTTDGAGAATASRTYYAYGAERSSSGTLQTDRTFTGQKSDATGLMYYNARYYDPALGTFVSPDTIVPDAGVVIDYNRYLYARVNSLRYTDPTGNSSHDYHWVQEFMEIHGRPPNEWDRLHRRFSLALPGNGPGNSWTAEDWALYSESLAAAARDSVSRTVQSQAANEPGSGAYGWQQALRRVGATIIYGLIPEGANAFGATGSFGFGWDVAGEVGVYFDKSGEAYVGYGIGGGGQTGVNADIGLFYQLFPWASNVRELEGWSVNIGLSGAFPWPAGASAGGELNVFRDKEASRPTVGFTVIGGASARTNIPVPNVKFYVHATYTRLALEFNLYDFFGLPGPDQ